MNVVYIVYGASEYECPFDPIKAFASRESAAALIDAIEKYKEARPDCPNEDASENEWERYFAAYAAWTA